MDLEILKEILEDTFDITVKVNTIIKQIKKESSLNKNILITKQIRQIQEIVCNQGSLPL